MALALALSIPLTAMASESDQDSRNSTTIREDNILNEDNSINNYKSQISMSLSNDNKKANYTIDITKDSNTENTSNLKAYIYLPDSSNLENIKLLDNDATASLDEATGMQKLSVDLANSDQSSLNIEADIKENATDNLSFDLVLVNEDENFKQIKKVVSEISKDFEGNSSLIDSNVSDMPSIITGKLLDENNIEWTDYLANNSDDDIALDYTLNISDNQKFEPSAVKIQNYKLSKDGYKALGSPELKDIEELSGTIIPAKSLVKITITSLVDSNKDDLWTLNGVSVTKDDKINESESSDYDKEAKEITENLDRQTEKIDTAIVNVDKDEDINTNRDSNKNQSIEENNVDNQAKEQEKSNKELQNSIDKNSKQDDNNKLNKDESNPQSAKNIEDVDVVKLTKDIDEINEKMLAAIKEIDEEEGIFLDSDQSDQDSPKVYDSSYITRLTAQIDECNRKIDEELTRLYGASTVKSIMLLSENIDEDSYKMLTELDETNEKLDEIVRQINLSIETGQILENPEEKEQIIAIIKELESLEDNNKKALEKIEEVKEGKEASKELELSPNFKIVVDGFSQNVYKDLKKVSTVTLDPLDKKESVMKVKEAREKYPTITGYLENLELRRDLLR